MARTVGRKRTFVNELIAPDGQLRPLLQSLFTPTTDCLRPAYAGVWRYLLFVGRKE